MSGMGATRADDGADPRDVTRRRRAVLAVVVAATVVVGGVGVVEGVRGDRWSHPADDGVAAAVPLADGADPLRDESASRADRPAVASTPGGTSAPSAAPTQTPAQTPTKYPTNAATPTPEPGSGLTGTRVVEALDGTLEVVPGSTRATGDGDVRTVRVEVEKGLPVDPEVFADAVLTTLDDPRGWGASDGVTFARTDGDADYRVVLASPGTVDDLCAPLDTGGDLSCGTGTSAVLNFRRWVTGAPDFDGDVVTYRHYLVNHEVGHLLGHGHVHCAGDGELADVMVQQSISTEGCRPNGWPDP
ncbi:uncharacterized protein DUF3152 [Sediminihabitans luteus]|uniref:Uncharacterized protein DUF3152 n=1 Tax=Sediminihabitans luteus TaxID=1138585 RepID=A0A2M9CYT9_9CELL|nr:DUF3152 domain-containing protein [Sediminihabitans luteus]PJJ77104.1 uncharacterized protein DUF3152 [Sediminihabitans luteus]GIJ00377.1 hypothetical protein Slu03_27540 [Sediminihabitans luteus]